MQMMINGANQIEFCHEDNSYRHFHPDYQCGLKKAQKKGLRTYHIVVLFLTSPLTVFLDYCLQRQALLLDTPAVKITAIYGLPLAFIFSFILYIISRKKRFK